MKIVWAIAFGAALGGVTRYLVAMSVQARFGLGFPWGTFLINVSGSLLLGFLLRYALSTTAVSVEVRALLTTGFCGGYTTFSTYSYETALLLEEGQYPRAVLYALASMATALAATFCGFMIARYLLTVRSQA